MTGRALRRVQPLAFAHPLVVRPQRRHVRGDRPAILGRERLLELGHRGARYADRDLAVHVHRRDGAHRGAVGETGGRRGPHGAWPLAPAPAPPTPTPEGPLPAHRRPPPPPP